MELVYWGTFDNGKSETEVKIYKDGQLYLNVLSTGICQIFFNLQKLKTFYSMMFNSLQVEHIEKLITQDDMEAVIDEALKKEKEEPPFAVKIKEEQ